MSRTKNPPKFFSLKRAKTFCRSRNFVGVYPGKRRMMPKVAGPPQKDERNLSCANSFAAVSFPYISTAASSTGPEVEWREAFERRRRRGRNVAAFSLLFGCGGTVNS
jgi:hypothetical protein